MRTFKDLTGKQFGRLTVVSPTDKRNASGCMIWKCKCSCDKTWETSSNSLQQGRAQSCGCLHKEMATRLGKTHLQDVSNTVINGIKVLRMSKRKGKRGQSFCFAMCPKCQKEWEVRVFDLKCAGSTQCKQCVLKQKVSKTCATFLDTVEALLDTKILREYKIETRYFDGYIPKFNLLIESDGVYWHSKEKMKRTDQIKEDLAKSAGLRLIRVINNNTMDHECAVRKVVDACY